MEQAPGPGHAICSINETSSAEISPAINFPVNSRTFRKDIRFSSMMPSSMGPAGSRIAGIFTLAAAINMAGMILSQLASSTTPSNRWASSMISTDAAIISRLGRIYRIPRCPWAIPSQAAMVLNSNGNPPDSRIPAFAASANSRWRKEPARISFQELAIAIMGFCKSDLLTPTACSNARCPTHSTPSVTSLLRKVANLPDLIGSINS